MEEQSHKDEMRSALRGDFERMRRRRTEVEPVGPVAPNHVPAAVSPEDERVVQHDAGSGSGSWLGRLLGRA